LADYEEVEVPEVEGQPIMVRKMNYAGRVVYSWSGLLVQTAAEELVVHAIFPQVRSKPPVIDGVPFLRGDIFTEYYYRDRWYNVFHIADPSGRHKGWYCNVSQPAQVDADGIAFVDMELDLFVHPDGRFVVLDEDEFTEAEPGYRVEDVAAARGGLEALIRLAEGNHLPRPFVGGAGTQDVALRPTPGGG
jgi:protein associated with RNAse G/E